MAELPPEILFFHILPRLPARSVLRLRSVCKQWRSFLKTPTFADMHCHHVTNDHRHNHHSLPFEAKPENIAIVASSDGLVCVGIKRTRHDFEYSDLILWNPLTGEYKTLSRANSNKECYMSTGRAFGLYHSSSNDDYKLLCVTYHRNVYIYSLKSDSWSKVESSQEDLNGIADWYSESWQPSVLLNEKLYFVRRVKRGTLSPVSYSIIRFDTKTEKFSEMAAPFRNLRIWWSKLMVIRGCIYLYVTYRIPNGYSKGFRHAIEIWKIDGDGDWRKAVSRCGLPSFPWNEQPRHVMKNGNWLTHSNEKGYVYKVDLKKRTKDQLFSYIGMDIVVGGKYIETFMSLNRYI